MTKKISIIISAVISLCCFSACRSEDVSHTESKISIESTQDGSKSAQEELAEIMLEKEKKKESLKTANEKAKLIYTDLAGACADLYYDNRSSDITVGILVKDAKELDEADPIERSIIYTLKNYDFENMYRFDSKPDSFVETGSLSGRIAYEIDESERRLPLWAQWVGDDGLVGQYPNPNTDPDYNYTFGLKNE